MPAVLKNTFAFTFFFLTVLCAFPQSSSELMKEYQKEKTLVKSFSYSDSSQMFEHGKNAIAIAKKMNQPVLEAEILMNYSNYFFFQTNYARARKGYEAAENIAIKYGNDTLTNIIRIKYAFIELEQGHWTSSRKGYEDAIARSEKTSDTTALLEALNGLATLKEKQNRNDEALDIYNRALRIAQLAKRTFQYAYLLNNRALLNIKLRFMDKARQDLYRAMSLTKEDRLKGNLLNNIGLIWMDKKMSDSALWYFEQFHTLAIKTGLPEWRVVSLINIAQIKAEAGKVDDAISNADSALKIAREHGIIFHEAKILNSLCDLYMRKKNHSKAIAYAKESIEVSAKWESLEDVPLAWDMLAEIYADQKDYAAAYEAMQKFKLFDDSLNNVTSQKRYDELLVQYDVEQKEKEIEEEKNKNLIMNQERELQESRIRFYVILGSAAFLICSGMLYIWYIRRNRRQQEQFSHQLIESIEGERSRIARELHDDIGANLSLIKNKLVIHSSNNVTLFGQLTNDIGQVIDHTRNISHQLYPGYLYKLGTTEAIRHFMSRVERDTSLTVHLELHEHLDKHVNDLQKMHMFRIIQELVNNTIKHADASNIWLNVQADEDKISMNYRDDGKGFGNEEGTGLGMTGMRERVKMLNGKMKVEESENGVKISFIFNLKEQTHAENTDS